MKLKFSRLIFKKKKKVETSNSIKIWAELFNAYTHMTKSMFTFCDVANIPKDATKEILLSNIPFYHIHSYIWLHSGS